MVLMHTRPIFLAALALGALVSARAVAADQPAPDRVRDACMDAARHDGYRDVQIDQAPRDIGPWPGRSHEGDAKR